MQAVSDVKAHYIILFNPRGNLTTVCLSKIGVSLIAKQRLEWGNVSCAQPKSQMTNRMAADLLTCACGYYPLVDLDSHVFILLLVAL